MPETKRETLVDAGDHRPDEVSSGATSKPLRVISNSEAIRRKNPTPPPGEVAGCYVAVPDVDGTMPMVRTDAPTTDVYDPQSGVRPAAPLTDSLVAAYSEPLTREFHRMIDAEMPPVVENRRESAASAVLEWERKSAEEWIDGLFEDLDSGGVGFDDWRRAVAKDLSAVVVSPDCRNVYGLHEKVHGVINKAYQAAVLKLRDRLVLETAETVMRAATVIRSRAGASGTPAHVVEKLLTVLSGREAALLGHIAKVYGEKKDLASRELESVARGSQRSLSVAACGPVKNNVLARLMAALGIR